MLIIEIALGIILGVLLLRYWPEIIGASIVLVLAIASIALFVGIILMTIGYPVLGLFILAIAFFSIVRKYWERFIEHKTEAVIREKRNEFGVWEG